MPLTPLPHVFGDQNETFFIVHRKVTFQSAFHRLDSKKRKIGAADIDNQLLRFGFEGVRRFLIVCICLAVGVPSYSYRFSSSMLNITCTDFILL